ncbi:MAG: ferritin-like domain-containing protein [Gemmatimonadales bacterium]
MIRFRYKPQFHDPKLPGGLMAIESLQDLLVDHLRDMYHAEKQLVKALPKMVKAASNGELRTAFEDHLSVTKEQVTRLERVFEELGTPARTKRCVGMEGLIEEGKELLAEDAAEVVQDAGLIAAAQKVEHYEISAYGTARTWARQLGLDMAAKLLDQSLEEEVEADETLSGIATNGANQEAE